MWCDVVGVILEVVACFKTSRRIAVAAEGEQEDEAADMEWEKMRRDRSEKNRVRSVQPTHEHETQTNI
jgi:hypothetical protein